MVRSTALSSEVTGNLHVYKAKLLLEEPEPGDVINIKLWLKMISEQL